MKVMIFGLGAIGSNLFVSLLKQFPDWDYVGIDFDVVEARNLRTQAYFREHIGQPKAAALRAVGMRYVQKLDYTPLKIKITEQHLNKSSPQENENIWKRELWIDCFDNSESRKILKQLFAKQHNAHLLHLGFSPLYSAECIWDEFYDVPNDVDAAQNDICSMVDAVGFIQMFIGHAAMNLNEWVATGKKTDFLITNKKTWVQL